MRMIGAVVAGYMVMWALVLGGDIVLEGVANFIFANLVLAFPYGFVGGWLAAKLAPEREINAGLLLALFSIAMGVVSYELTPSRQPVWYWTALTASLMAGAVYGSFQKYRSVQQRTRRKKKKAK